MRKLLVILGVPVDNLTMAEALDRCDEFIAVGRATGRLHQIATVNADFVVNALHDPELRRILQEADMATADGMPLVWASRLLGGPLPGRVTGADMVPALAERAAQRGYSIFFLGAREGVAAKAAAILQERYPGLRVAGVLSPPPGSVLDMDRSIVETVKAARPDILLVAFGNPKQEKWIRMYAHELRVPIAIGVGGTFDMIVGVTKRAPVWMQRVGLEWVYRLAQEPRRLWKRYVHDFIYFGYFFARQWWAMQRGRALTIIPTAPAAPSAAPEAPAVPEPPAASLPWPVLTVEPRLEVANLEPFTVRANQLLEAHPFLILDLSATRFLDSSALGALVALAKRARTKGGDLFLLNVQEPVRQILDLLKLNRFFEQFSDLAAIAEWMERQQQPAPIQPAPTLSGWTIIPAPRVFDATTAPALLEQTGAALARGEQVVIDCSQTTFMASAGMAALVKLDRLAREQGSALRLAGCAHDVLRTLQLVRLDQVLAIFPDVSVATATPTKPAPIATEGGLTR
ncbi:WecB/TagA/CpsF family glycosyltransferase [Chloroflexus sp.]|uniref:WecB/TagA/CpsF family glycosyltransferase n=1 Tax=Chloroflexus sp. TaxID=1904827 RepID=UPI00262E62E5|nr:WecB/TagA/CpsF family glycosyltransferase [uncultured Chloroflexus sp.]